MDWIKRNLLFVIGAVVALALLGGAGWYTFTRYTTYAAAKEKLNAAYEELKRLKNQNPSPGDDKVDNIKNARDQEQEVQRLLARTGKHFQSIPPVVTPTSNAFTGQLTVTGESFAAALRQVIDQLQKDAAAGSVALPPKSAVGPYAFSFQAQQSLLKFAPGSLEPLAVQLAEVRELVGVLNRAKVNSLESIRRERAGEDDQRSTVVTDYLDRVSITNEQAVLTPYELTFRCFSPELAAVLAGFAASPYSLVVKGFNVEPASATAGIDPTTGLPLMEPTYAPVPSYVPQPVLPQPQLQPRRGVDDDVFARRYGTAKGSYAPQPVAPPPVMAPTVAAPAAPRIQTVLDERQLKVTMLVYVIKLLPPKN